MTYIMSCVWLDYMIKYFQCKNCVGSSPKTKKCVASFLVPVYKRGGDSKESPPLFDRRPAPALGMGCAGNRNRLRAAQGNALRHAACLFTR